MIRKRLLPLFLSVIILPMGCQDELADRYLNSDKATSATLGQFFTAMLNNNRMRPSYWELSTFVNWHIGVYTQSVGFLNSPTVFQQNESYVQDRWNDFYRPSANGSGVMAIYREIEKNYEALSALDKIDNEIFLRAAQVVLYDQATQMVDLWGDIPFSEAGMLNKTGDIIYAKFDNASEIYHVALHDLEFISGYFEKPVLSSSTEVTFSKQDILLNGNLALWRKYTNSLRLRLLMRISYADEARARNEVITMLSNSEKYPMLGEEDDKPPANEILLNPLTNYTDDLHAAFTDWTNYPAPYFMLEKVLKPANDLRIPVLFDKYGSMLNNHFEPNEEFNAMPLNLPAVEQQAALGKYAILDSVTFLYNPKLPGVIMTSAEVNFLKAEAFERWGGGDPFSEYKKGIRNSIEFYYHLNSLNTKDTETPPTEQEIDDFLDKSLFIQYTGTTEEKLSKIWTQKWVHFGFLQAGQRWAEQRRTAHPRLEFFPATQPGYELPPSRLTYPASERTFNGSYQNVAGSDKRDGKIFWDVR
jgi:hypothetical protein